jgi:tetratricopeptide (TPR) repeat protein
MWRRSRKSSTRREAPPSPPSGAPPTPSRLERLEQILRADPQSRIFAPLADGYRRAGRYDEALALCEAGLRRYPTWVAARVVRARIQHDAGALEAAAESLAEVLRLIPDQVRAQRTLGEIQLSLGRAAQAAAALERAVALYPCDGEARRLLARLRAPAAPEAEAAVAAAEPAAAGPAPPAAPGERDVLATETMADLFAEQGHHDQAIPIYERLLAEDPSQLHLRWKLERVRALRERPPEPPAPELPGTGQEVERLLAELAAAPLPREARSEAEATIAALERLRDGFRAWGAAGR